MSRTFESRRRPTWRHLGPGPQSLGVGRRVFYRLDDLHDWIDVQHGYGAPVDSGKGVVSAPECTVARTPASVVDVQRRPQQQED